jgi:hypothetical protein
MFQCDVSCIALECFMLHIGVSHVTYNNANVYD